MYKKLYQELKEKYSNKQYIGGISNDITIKEIIDEIIDPPQKPSSVIKSNNGNNDEFHSKVIELHKNNELNLEEIRKLKTFIF